MLVDRSGMWSYPATSTTSRLPGAGGQTPGVDRHRRRSRAPSPENSSERRFRDWRRVIGAAPQPPHPDWRLHRYHTWRN